MPTVINGLPAHILLIHAVVVLIPLAAIMTVFAAVWPAARRRLGVFTPAVAFVGLVLVPVTTNAGEWLEHRLPESRAIQRHADLGDTLLPFAVALFVLSAAVWYLGRRSDAAASVGAPGATETGTDGVDGPVGSGSGGTATAVRPAQTRTAVPAWATLVVAVLAVVASVGATVQVYRIGDSGAQASWSYVKDLPQRPGRGGD